MKVFILDADVNNYRGIYYKDEDDIVDFNRRFIGNPLKRDWKGHHKFEFVPARLPKGDSPGLSTHIPVFSTRAVKALVHCLEGNGELLPIVCDGEDFFLFNVTRVIDALDETNSEVKRFTSGRIMDVITFSFHQERLLSKTVFKIPQLVLSDVFVTDPFVERVIKAKLKGFKFHLVWSSD